MDDPLSLWYLLSGLAVIAAVLVSIPIVLAGLLICFFVRKLKTPKVDRRDIR